MPALRVVPDREPEQEKDPPTEAPSANTWLPVDTKEIIGGLLDGTITQPTPTVGRRPDGQGLFYAGRVNSLFGESGDGKTWLALVIAAQELEAGQNVLWVDFEDSPQGILSRLILNLDVDPDIVRDNFLYIQPGEALGELARFELDDCLAERQPSLVVIDSQGEAMAVQGIKTGNEDTDVTLWMKTVPKHISKQGPAVLIIDHVPKAKDGNSHQYAIGSQRKRAALTGAGFSVEVFRPFGKGNSGRAKLISAKDRNGTYPKGAKAAEFALDATGGTLIATIEMPDVSPEGEFLPTALMEKVSRYVETHSNATTNEIADNVRGKRDFVLKAIDQLVANGHLTVQVGARGSHQHHATKAYREPIQ